MRYQPQGRWTLKREYLGMVAGGWIAQASGFQNLGTASLSRTARFISVSYTRANTFGFSLTSNSASDAPGNASVVASITINSPPARRNFTFAGVFQVRGTEGAGVGARSSQSDILFRRENGNYSVSVNSVKTVGPAMPLNTPLHYVLTSNAQGIYLYVNGEEILTAVRATSTASTGAGVEIYEDTLRGGAMDLDAGMCVLLNKGVSKEWAKSISENLWQMFGEDEDQFDEPKTQAVIGYVDTAGRSTGSVSVTAVARAVARAYGTSQGVGAASGVARAVTASKGTAEAISSSQATAYSVFSIKGDAQSTSQANASAFSVVQAKAEGAGISYAQASAVSVSSSRGNSVGAATVEGNAACVWQVSGRADGNCVVNAEAWYEEGGGRVVFDTQGASYGSATSTALAQTVQTAYGASTGTSTVSSNSQVLLSAIGSALASSSANAQGVSVVSTTGLTAGSSVVNSVSVAIYNSVANSLSSSEVQAITQSVVETIGESKGTAKVSGVTDGGVHYLAAGDQYSITLVFSPYAIEYNGKDFRIDRNDANEFTIKRN